jgi:sigma-B regulation protein RsbU (phosphoserine phosphatase)
MAGVQKGTALTRVLELGWRWFAMLAGAGTAPTGGTVSNQPTHVLLIEDNQGDADLVRLRLVESNSDLEVSCADRLSTGLAALAVKPPAVVLLDLNLPDSRGADTFREVLHRAPSVPVVVLSGRDDEDLAITAIHQGAQDYLVKGQFDGRQLGRAMRYAVERQGLLTALDMSRKQQLQFKEQFLSQLSHELRTPLTCAHQFVTILLEELAGPLASEQRDHLETILRSVNQVRVMIGDLIEATRAESGKTGIEPRSVVISEVIRQAVAMLTVTAGKKGIGLQVRLDPRIPLVWADPERVFQALINLIASAIMLTPPEKSILVEARLMDLDPGFVHVSVEDTGSGIRPEAKAPISERLFQIPGGIDASRTRGFHITKELVRLHGGRLWAESQPGYGSTVSFTLPLFSLAKFLFPVITDQGHLRHSIVLITAEIASQLPLGVGDWREISQRCQELLQLCVLPGEGIVVPAMENAGQVGIFLIVASTDEHGTTLLVERVRTQLRHCAESKASGVFKVSARPVTLPSEETNSPLERLVQIVADKITEMAASVRNKNVAISNQSTKIGRGPLQGGNQVFPQH